MGASAGPRVWNGQSAKAQLRTSRHIAIRSAENGPVVVRKVYADITSDPEKAWFLVIMAFPRVASVYNSAAVGTDAPSPTDTSMSKVTDTTIRTILNLGNKETRTQWFHTSEADGSVWADGSLNNSSTMYNLFEYPDNWNSDGAASGNNFKRRQGPGTSYGDWITTANTGCSGAAGGWSNYREDSCVISWFAGCEGTPAYNHCCACPVDRAQQLIVWAA